ncbi:hypothetical protein PDE_05782 [Penicillium oxalicum 114-2]|uniref:DUF5703 domain-containing protein n=1 Tax=Penicillium oxalicum (strain 114-2 / CGMCC 5302) TaxID=933388 RepID=S7ZJQ6_PENO1|nr:hypothetical protein PDE_05782 [Penicillium oxalicum 114-2]
MLISASRWAPLALIVSSLHLWCLSVSAVTLPDSYDVVWTTPSKNSAGSMPLGGGDIGLNAWSENGAILFYIQKSGTFDENNSFLKLGRVRLAFDPNPFTGGFFEQRLVINDGYVRFTGDHQTVVNLWVDVHNPVIHADIQSAIDIKVTASYENWRYEDYAMRQGEQAQSSWGAGVAPQYPNITSYADKITYHRRGILMSHRNEKLPLWDFQTAQQQLSKFKDQLYTPMRDNEFGLWMYSPQLQPGHTSKGTYVNTPFKAWALLTRRPMKSFNIQLALYQDQTSSHADWLKGLQSIIDNALTNTMEDTISWWHRFWDRSYIIINENATMTDPGFQVGKNYQLWRYTMGCNAYGQWPTKFNGGMHTFDPVFVDPNEHWTPDYRRWGGGTFTAQNQRLLYWPLLRSGDFDVMKAQFEFYRRITGNARLVASHFFNVTAAHFNEQIDNSGLPNVYEYDGNSYRFKQQRPANYPVGECWSSWLVFLQDTANEFADMILQANLYSGFDVSPYLDFIESQLAWFDRYYQRNLLSMDAWSLNGANGDGQLIIYPASGAETYKNAYNPASTIAGLRKVIKDLLKVDQFKLSNSTYYESYLKRIPETPLRVQQGHTTIAPAIAYSRLQNSEIPQLYPVFPWGEFGLGLPNLTIALDTYNYDTETQDFKANVGWKQDVIWMARMGVTHMAANMTEERFADSTTFRFPVFKGPNFDWAPDMNHYGSGSIGLQEQLLQTTAGDEIRLFGAWPDRWNARFKLWAPQNTTVEGVVYGGTMTRLAVTPSSRMSDVVYGSA